MNLYKANLQDNLGGEYAREAKRGSVLQQHSGQAGTGQSRLP
jgi:hypothetical protein